jgi:hypothetical protein
MSSHPIPVPNNPNDKGNPNSEALKHMSDFINNALRAAEDAAAANPAGSSYSPDYSHPQPYVPSENSESELEGVEREKFPINYQKFDPETGLFGDSSEAD